MNRAFVAYFNAAIGERTRRRLPRWVPVLLSSAAAAVLLLVFQTVNIEQIPVQPRVADAAPAVVVETETAPRPVQKVHRRQVIAPMKPPNTNWALAEPSIQIAIPVEAMFPPGAVPEGITFIADLSVAADGSVQGVRLQQ